jgi:beta-glucanase (GH16 family)/GR25 family glycosyltransferase involved in LPS biosynthesis
MNMLTFADFKERFAHRLRLRTRVLDLRRRAKVFSSGDESDAIKRIYVINLDRKPDRWSRLRRELNRFQDRHGEQLSTVVRRFSAIDARYLKSEPDHSTLIPTFTLADQLTIDPNPLLLVDDDTRARKITMTRQEIAVALSHIEVWKLIAEGEVPSALVLEDDIVMPYGFVRNLEETWSAVEFNAEGVANFDLLYLAFRDVGASVSPQDQALMRRKDPGLWEASGYVVTREGARKLLDRLPMYGPVDLWLNLQFHDLKVFTAARPIVEQRLDEPSTNSYSVLPVLSQVGVITREKPLVTTAKKLRGPVIALGDPGSGLSALAKALSMSGYTCCSDLGTLPALEQKRLLTGRRNRLFNAYVNIGTLDSTVATVIAKSNPDALFILTSPGVELPLIHPDRVLSFDDATRDKWALLCDFIGIDYPSFPYPNDADLGQRPVVDRTPLADSRASTNHKFDKSPWTVSPAREDWNGFSLESLSTHPAVITGVNWTEGEILTSPNWKLRDDTFPSNLSLFSPDNFNETNSGSALLTFQEERTSVREFTSAAIASGDSYLYGRFAAELRPSSVPGLITGIFLHRNGPRQEIDIEFLGKDTTKMLVNVYYNPGPEGTKLEYGYRGTPTQIDLGFDAAADFHTYEIDWQPNVIRWKVDGLVVHERTLWNPTPIPDQPLEFNINLWHSRSVEFAGRLEERDIPTTTELRSLEVRTYAPDFSGSYAIEAEAILHS